MALDFTPQTVASGVTGTAAIEENYTNIQIALADGLSRSGTSPNTMGADLDMNSNDILNAKALNVQSLSINGTQVEAVGVPTAELPSQTGHSGKHLTTNGTSTSWNQLDDGDILYTPPGTGAETTLTLANKLDELWVSVKNFGAVGDGATDDHASIQEAIDYVNTNGGKLYFPPGDYICSGQLAIDRDTLGDGNPYAIDNTRIEIIGSGKGCTQIDFTGATSGESGFNIDGNDDNAAALSGWFVMRDITLTGASVAGSYGVDISDFQYVLLENVNIHNFDGAVYTLDSTDLKFSNCYIYSNNNKGIHLDTGTTGTRSTFEDCYFYANGGEAIHVENPTTCTIRGGHAIQNDAGGTSGAFKFVNFAAAEDWPVTVSITGVHFDKNDGKSDIYLDNGLATDQYAVTCVGCVFRRTTVYTSAVDNNIYVEGSGTNDVKLNIIGCSFESESPYVADATREYIGVQTSGSDNVQISYMGNTYDSATGGVETQTISGPGALYPYAKTVLMTTTGADAFTLADSSEGDELTIIMVADGGNGTLTPTNLQGGTTITFDDVEDTAYLKFLNGNWHMLAGTATLA